MVMIPGPMISPSIAVPGTNRYELVVLQASKQNQLRVGKKVEKRGRKYTKAPAKWNENLPSPWCFCISHEEATFSRWMCIRVCVCVSCETQIPILLNGVTSRSCQRPLPKRTVYSAVCPTFPPQQGHYIIFVARRWGVGLIYFIYCSVNGLARNFSLFRRI